MWGYKDNADFNAAKNIRNRVLVTVLRESLLKQMDNGAFEPKKLMSIFNSSDALADIYSQFVGSSPSMASILKQINL